MKILGICGALVIVAGLAPAAALADSPRHFLRDAIRGDNSEIVLGRMAHRQASTERVRDFGRTLRDDHSLARDQARAVAARMGIGRVREMTPEARHERDRLSHLHGRAFDRAFVRYMIDDHRKDIAAFKDEAREHHGAAGRLAREQLPTLQKHLDMAMAIQSRQDERMANRNDHYDGWRHR